MVLKIGSRGNLVKDLQKRLHIGVDGIYGKGTESAVKRFQIKNNIKVDGIAGPTTMERLKNAEEFQVDPVILKNGSRGNNVKKLQKVLSLHPDGIFGKLTENKVKDYQLKNGLTMDGIVGPSTWKELGFTIKDKVQRNENSFKATDNGLIINEHFLDNDEYMKGSVPKAIFLHHTAGWYNPYKVIDNWNNDNRGSVSTEFIIGGQSIKADEFKYDGELVKAFPKGGWGWHLGIGRTPIHKNSIGIEVNNFGYLTKGGYRKGNTWINKNSNDFYTYAGTRADSSQIVELDKEFRGFKYWHKYSDKQIETIEKLLKYISERDNIDIKKGIPSLIKDLGANAFDYIPDVKNGKKDSGIWSHTTVRKDKFDMFPQQELLDMLVSL